MIVFHVISCFIEPCHNGIGLYVQQTYAWGYFNTHHAHTMMLNEIIEFSLMADLKRLFSVEEVSANLVCTTDSSTVYLYSIYHAPSRILAIWLMLSVLCRLQIKFSLSYPIHNLPTQPLRQVNWLSLGLSALRLHDDSWQYKVFPNSAIFFIARLQLQRSVY